MSGIGIICIIALMFVIGCVYELVHDHNEEKELGLEKLKRQEEETYEKLENYSISILEQLRNSIAAQQFSQEMKKHPDQDKLDELTKKWDTITKVLADKWHTLETISSATNIDNDINSISQTINVISGKRPEISYYTGGCCRYIWRFNDYSENYQKVVKLTIHCCNDKITSIEPYNYPI